MPPITMTREEYKRRYGVAPIISTPDQELAPAPRRMTRAEYNAEFGTSEQPKEGFFTKAGNAINEVNPFYQIPKMLIEGAAKLGTGLGEVLDSKSPSEVIKPTTSALAGGTQMALAVPFGLFESATNLPGVKQIKNFLMNPEKGVPKWVGDKIGEWKPLQDFVAQHPDSPEVVGDIITVALGLAGTKEAKSPEFKNNMIYVKSKVVEPTINKLETGLDTYKANQNTKITAEVANDLVNVKNGVNRKNLTPAIQAKDMESATRLAETDALSGMVNNKGTIDPLLINDAIARYRFLREGDIDRSLVKNRLIEETKATNGATATNVGELTAAITEAADRFTGSFRDKLDGAIASEIRGLSKRANENGQIKLEDIHQAKIDNALAASKDYGKLSSDAIEWRKAKANAYKTIVERNSKVNVVVGGKIYKIKDINKELGKTEQDVAFLRSLANRKVEGGRLGQHFASISGNLIGYAAGSMFGPLGGAIGSALGGEMARGMKGKQFERTFGKDRGLPVEKNKILQEANKPQTTDVLRIPDKVIKATASVKKTPEITKVEAQIKRNVEAQKKAIKKGDFTLVATLKEIYKNLVQHLKDLIKKIKETPNKEGGFVKNPLQSSKSLGNRNQIYKPNKIATTTAISDTISPLAEKIKSTGEQKPTIKLKRDVQITTLSGEKVTIPEAEVLKAYESGGKALLKDGREYIVSKSQYENIKNNSLKSESKPFAPELKGTEETVKGASKWDGDNLMDNGEVKANLIKNEDGTWSYQSDFSEGEATFKTRKEAMKDAEMSAVGTFSDAETKYSQYQLPEGKNYKEILIKAPRQKEFSPEKAAEITKKAFADFDAGKITREERNKLLDSTNKYTDDSRFQSSHWDEKGVISHLRLNERTYKGKKVTFMEELQSDWAREGRSKGFVRDRTPAEMATEKALVDKGVQSLATGKIGEVPNNPLLKNWQELSVKRALKEAVDNNSEYLAWTTGEQQAARYNLAKEVKEIDWIPAHKSFNSAVATGKPVEKVVSIKPQTGGVSIDVGIDNAGVIHKVNGGGDKNWVGKKIDEVIGKGLGEKILKEESGNLSGEGLNIGGEWAKNLYDKQVKNIVEDLTGSKVEIIDMGLGTGAKETTFKYGTGSGLEKLTPKALEVGLEIRGFGDNTGSYIITDILGDGKFVAAPKIQIDMAVKDSKQSLNKLLDSGEINEWGIEPETFDISTKKSTGQQAIKIDDRIKALVKGEALNLK